MCKPRLVVVCVAILLLGGISNYPAAHSADLLVPKSRFRRQGPVLPPGFGLAYGAYRQHESPDGLQPTEEEIREDLRLLKAILPEPRRIRVYSSLGPGKLAAIIAAEEGFLVTLGAWIGPERNEKERKQNEDEVAELIGIAPLVRPELLVIGNESILRSDVTPARLKEHLAQVKAALPDMKVATAEPWATWVIDPRGKELVNAVDVLMVHVHPFWEKIPAQQAPQVVFKNLGEVRNRFGKPVVLGETGWPSAGMPQDEAVPSDENQRAFISGLLNLFLAQDSKVFLFSAFDEPFKGVAERGSDTDAAAEGITGAHWGIFSWNRRLKPLLKDILGTPDEPNPSSLIFRLLTRGSLAPGFDLGIDTGQFQRDWLKKLEPEESGRLDGSPSFRLAFPEGQCWGSVFITTRKPTPDLEARRVTDLSDFDRIALDLRLIEGEDEVEIAPKNPEWPDDGTESKVIIRGLTSHWQTAVIPLSMFNPTDPKRLYVAAGLDFFGLAGKTIDVAEIRFLPKSASIDSSLTVASLRSRSNLNPYILQRGVLNCGYGLGIATEDPLLADWLKQKPGFLQLAYPGGRAWASAYFTVGNPPPPGGRKLIADWTGRSFLALEIRGKDGGELCYIGVRSSITSSYSQSLARTSFRLSPKWTWVYVPLNSLTSLHSSSIHVAASIELDGPFARTIEVRNIRVL